jgi:hypothetical protein
VATTPFDDVPKSTFVTRLIWPSAILFFVLVMLVGVVVNSPLFEEHTVPTTLLPFWQAAFQHYRNLVVCFSQIPSVCWAGNAVNEFQKHQCTDYWEQLAKAALLAISPLVLTGLFLAMGIEKLGSHYKKAQKKVEKGKVFAKAVVTHPAEAPQDVFSWLYCFRPITAQLANRTQITVYLALEAPCPLPGETLVVFEMGAVFGEKRYVGMVYTPHIAVVRGS